MNAALYVGEVKHQRFLPRSHGFRAAFFMWFFNLDRLHEVADLSPWFAIGRGKRALLVMRREDYLGHPAQSLAEAVRARMAELTGERVEGEVYGLLNLSTLGLYFSPVNLYYGYDGQGRPSHFLAEVSNIPWNERHHYGFLLPGDSSHLEHAKAFQVSPFNHLQQRYRWHLEPPGEQLAVTIAVGDSRGEVFEANLNLARRSLERKTLLPLLATRPVMTAYIVGGIYYQALKLFLKGVPYIPYRKEAT